MEARFAEPTGSMLMPETSPTRDLLAFGLVEFREEIVD